MNSENRGRGTRPTRAPGGRIGKGPASHDRAHGQAQSIAAARAEARLAMYRRRRITVSILAVVVLAVLVLGIVLMVKAIGQMREQAAQPVPVEATAEPTAPGPEGDTASGNCPADEVGVNASVNAEEFPVGENPQFTIEVENGHSADCLIDVGTEQQEFVVRSEGDTVWSSTYCADPDADDEVKENRLVFPAEAKKKTTLTWNRVPVDDSCKQVGEDFPGGDYELVVKLGDTESDPVPFTLAAQPEEGSETDDPEAGAPDSED